MCGWDNAPPLFDWDFVRRVFGRHLGSSIKTYLGYTIRGAKNFGIADSELEQSFQERDSWSFRCSRAISFRAVGLDGIVFGGIPED
jgi:hypothetical protein